MRLRAAWGMASYVEAKAALGRVVESCFSVTRTQCRNVKRWRSSEMAWRWAGSMLLEAEKGFRRVKGHRGMRSLLEALGFSLDKQETVG